MSLVGVYLGVAGAAIVGLVRTLRTQSQSRSYLEAALDEDAPQLDHLPRALAALVRDARSLRTSLDAPERLVKASGRLAILGANAEELDSQLLELSRALGDWLAAIERLADVDREMLEARSAEQRKLAALFRRENFAIERRVNRGGRPLAATLDTIRGFLVEFERSLLHSRVPYR